MTRPARGPAPRSASSWPRSSAGPILCHLIADGDGEGHHQAGERGPYLDRAGMGRARRLGLGEDAFPPRAHRRADPPPADRHDPVPEPSTTTGTARSPFTSRAIPRSGSRARGPSLRRLDPLAVDPDLEIAHRRSASCRAWRAQAEPSAAGDARVWPPAASASRAPAAATAARAASSASGGRAPSQRSAMRPVS